VPRSAQRYRAARAAKLAELTSQPGFRRNLLLLGLPGVMIMAIGLFTTSFLIRVGAGVGVALPAAYYLWLQSRASKHAKTQTMTAWAAERGWTYVPKPVLPVDVAFCRDRPEMDADDGFEGTICGLPGLIFNFTYSTYRTHTTTTFDGTTQTTREEKKQRHTVFRLELGPIPGVPTMQLAPRGVGILEKLEDAFGPSRRVETESVEFGDRFSLTVDDSADQAPVLRIFTPALQMRLIEGAFPHTTFQFEAGALAYVWPDQYDVSELEEIEARVASVTPLTAALTDAVARLRVTAEA
jgi:hypothetical protein